MFTSENQSDKNMLTNRVVVLMRYYFSKILLRYTWGPFQKARPVSPERTARVKMQTNLAGERTIEKMFIKLQSIRRAHKAKEAKAYFMFGSLGKKLNTFWRHVWGLWSWSAC